MMRVLGDERAGERLGEPGDRPARGIGRGELETAALAAPGLAARRPRRVGRSRQSYRRGDGVAGAAVRDAGACPAAAPGRGRGTFTLGGWIGRGSQYLGGSDSGRRRRRRIARARSPVPASPVGRVAAGGGRATRGASGRSDSASWPWIVARNLRRASSARRSTPRPASCRSWTRESVHQRDDDPDQRELHVPLGVPRVALGAEEVRRRPAGWRARSRTRSARRRR